MGFWRGIIKSISGFLGLIVGIIFAGIFYVDVVAWAGEYIPLSEKVLNVVAFLVILVLAARIVDFILNKVFAFISILPFVKTINRLAGGAFGLIQGIIVLGLAVFIYSKFPFWEVLDSQMIDSQVAPALLFLVKFAITLLPDALKEIEGLI